MPRSKTKKTDTKDISPRRKMSFFVTYHWGVVAVIHKIAYKLIKKYNTRDTFKLATFQNITARYENLPFNIDAWQ